MKTVNLKKLAYYLKEEMIIEFENAQAALEYFNTYDYQNLKTIEELKALQGDYGFGYGGKWYHINFDEALDVYN